MYLVMLRHDWGGPFRRTIAGVRREFAPGVPQEVAEEDLGDIREDLYNALMPVELDEKGRPRVLDRDLVMAALDAMDTETGGKTVTGGNADDEKPKRTTSRAKAAPKPRADEKPEDAPASGSDPVAPPADTTPPVTPPAADAAPADAASVKA